MAELVSPCGLPGSDLPIVGAREGSDGAALTSLKKTLKARLVAPQNHTKLRTYFFSSLMATVKTPAAIHCLYAKYATKIDF